MIVGQILTQTATAAADLLPSVDSMRDAYESKNWMLLAGLILTGIVALTRKLGLLSMLDAANSKWAAVGIAMLGAVGGGLMLGMAWPVITVTGLSAGLIAIGGWETVGKMLKAKE